MRLKEREVKIMKELFIKVFGRGELYLFGSRADDRKKGGDIDLYVVPESVENVADKK